MAMTQLRITPNKQEIVMRDGDLIVSKTDPKGRITYGNRAFNHYSGFSEDELLGVQHNIVRHPDMPRAVFKLLWDRLNAGQEVFAFVKNIAKSGSFYWVFANVTPSYDVQGQLLGYFSVRRKPNPSALVLIEPLYRRMLQVEKDAGSRDAIAASTQLLMDALAAQNTSYDDFVLNLQGI
ncbi:PAS domain-containing protein [Limnohabitans radicicola]|nr:PAS domain-containing protein [Limnohabitans radicicola]